MLLNINDVVLYGTLYPALLIPRFQRIIKKIPVFDTLTITFFKASIIILVTADYYFLNTQLMLGYTF